MTREYRLFCTACSFETVVEGIEETLATQAAHEDRHRPTQIHFVEFKRVGEPSVLFPRASATPCES